MIRRLLVANRGEIARRIFATCRAMGIETVAVYSDADADLPYVSEADYAVRLPGSAPTATYLRGDLIVNAARKAGADAVHPGYGFLSERADFAAAVATAGLTWIGPPAKVIAAMGAKLDAKKRVAQAGVPTLPTWTHPLDVDSFPVMVKASAGGGGRGMRFVLDPSALPDALESASHEALAAFGDGTVFCEPYIDRARHIEVQLMADGDGNVVTFGERECSIQRRHQKIIEETPSPMVSQKLRGQLCDAATAVARAIDYVGAGTVEFIVAPNGDYFFLEMNTRLQVEHGVTECVVGMLDLVRLQLLVAEGGVLPYDGAPPLRGHAIEARLYAEDPSNAWLPSTGTLHRFHIPGISGEFRPLIAPGLRLDSGVETGTQVGVHYDPLLAKVIAWAPTRGEAARLLASTLARAHIHGVVTNRDLLVQVLRHTSFRSGQIDIGFLERHPDVFAPLVSSTESAKLSCLAAALAGAAARHEASAGPRVPIGWRNVGGVPQLVGYQGPGGSVEVSYQFDRSGNLAAWSVRRAERSGAGAPGILDLAGPEPEPPVEVVAATAERVSLDVTGIRVDFDVHTVGHVSYVDSTEGSITLVELPRFPEPRPDLAEGSLVAPLPGAVGRVVVTPGQRVTSGDLLLTVEAMKLEHPVHAPSSGVVAELPVAAGAQVDTGAILAVIKPDDAVPTPAPGRRRSPAARGERAASSRRPAAHQSER
ncbi:MAG TPA: biotin carboxylase N-terminal domain-containing protein [Micromonosporaceae bacterium]|jgi:propionyl-CoA carboxylase alpha chain|nr:biotin carboxylase N-terminal domain-containing protein [Micromonosporaceae bacterium]